MTCSRATMIAILLILAVAGCGSESESRPESGSVQFHEEGRPESLAQWNLLFITDGQLRLNDGVLPYDLDTQLFSDYAHKLRTIWMPEGVAAQSHDREAIEFPVGTIISKTFYYPAAHGAPDDAVLRTAEPIGLLPGGALDLRRVHLVETRLLVRREQGWLALPYVWNEAQTEARLKRTGALLPLTLAADDGTQEAITYQIPDQNQCAACHATDLSSKALHPLGPKAWNLDHEYVYTDGPEQQLTRWAQAGYLNEIPHNTSSGWPDFDTDLEARTRAYLDVNCGHCHSAQGPGSTSGLWLDISVREPLRLGRCKRPIAAGRGTGGHRFGFVPGQPNESILLYRMESDDPAVRMPEIGRSVAHREGVELIRAWIIAQSGGNCGG